jgi:uncharacterized protein
MILIDTNILIYAVDNTAPQHFKARAWVEETFSGNTPVGLPWIVLVGFIRVSTNHRAMRAPMSVEQSLKYTDQFLQHPHVTPLNPGERHWLILERLLHESGTAGNLTNDAHIAAIAIEHGYTVYSTDNDFKRFAGVHHINPLESHEVHETAAPYRSRSKRRTA